MASRVALFGGTFDPIHNAHLEVARAAADHFCLHKVLFIPSYNPPHKEGAKAAFEDRARMCELACRTDPRFEVSRIEEGSERSYSILTIEKLQAAGMRELGFLIGADAFAEFGTWHRWEDVAKAVEFLVVTRPGAEYAVPEGALVRELPGLELRESSSEVRSMLGEGKWEAPVPPGVLAYIRSHHLYGT